MARQYKHPILPTPCDSGLETARPLGHLPDSVVAGKDGERVQLPFISGINPHPACSPSSFRLMIDIM